MKRKLRITLIAAADTKDHLVKKNPFMPLALPILASVAPDHEYKFIDMLTERDKIDFNDDSDIIGISLRQSAAVLAYELADKFRKNGKTVVLGGAQPSSVPFMAKEHADSVVVGEAEELWPIFLDDFMKGESKDFYVCSPLRFDPKGATFYQQNEFPDLTNLPIPYRHLYKGKYSFDLTFASRGCPVSCDFCVVSDLFGKRIRLKPIDDVVKDIQQFKKFYYLLDDTVFGRPDCYDYYLELYDRIAELPKRKLWTGQANLDAASNEKGREVIRRAAKAGLVYAAIGIESINQSTLKANGAYSKHGLKDSTDIISKMKENIAFIQDQGIAISGWFTIGYENDSIQTYYDTLDFCKETNILPVFSPIRALHGSRLFNRLQGEGKIQDMTNRISNVSHSGLKDEEVLKAMDEVIKSGYSPDEQRKRRKFYRKKFSQSEKSFSDVLYKTIFTQVTQKKMRKIVTEEIKYFTEKIEKNV